MAQRVGIVVDSTADLPTGMAEALQVEIIPVHIFVDGKDHLHGSGISNPQVIDALRQRREEKKRRRHFPPSTPIYLPA